MKLASISTEMLRFNVHTWDDHLNTWHADIFVLDVYCIVLLSISKF